LKLKPERIAPVHGRVVPYKNLLTAFDLWRLLKGHAVNVVRRFHMEVPCA